MEVDDRLDPYLGIVAALTFVALIFIFAYTAPAKPISAGPIPMASSTLSVVPTFSFPALPIEFPSFASTSPEKTPPKAAIPKAVTPPVYTPPPLPLPSLVMKPEREEDEIVFSPQDEVLVKTAIALRSALVNILCYIRAKNGTFSVSGGGVFVDEKGIILTNAHIAQHFLLEKGVSCTIRSGTPATDKYTAKLIYISPSWVKANPGVIAKTTAKGTGEFDFAFLAVTGTAAPTSTLPKAFPAIPLGTEAPPAGAPVVIATYGAQALGPTQLQNGLSPTVVFGSVKEWLTFAINSPDVISLGGSAAAQYGSSGGGVANEEKKLVGVITTSTVQGDISTRRLNALTASYIREQYLKETVMTLDSLLARPISVSIEAFLPVIPVLREIVIP